MKEATLKRKFIDHCDDFLLLTVDDNRLYRVYFEDEPLSHNREYSFTSGLVTHPTYLDATRAFRAVSDYHTKRYFDGLKRQYAKTGITPDVFRRMLMSELIGE